MRYHTFNQHQFDATKQPMFFGEPVNVARYDVQRFPVFEKLIEKQLSFFWRPEEIDLSKDSIDFASMPEHERHIFISNLKYQTLLDSVQGRSPNVAFLPVVSLPELETWLETWAFSETIHSRSYTHIIRNIFNDPAEIFDDIIVNDEIIKRAVSVTEHYDDFIEHCHYFNLLGEGTHQVNGQAIVVNLRELKKKLYLTVAAVNVLEAIRFYVSFACAFAFGERAMMEGNAKIIKLIARDEALHLSGTQQMLTLMREGKDDPEMVEIAQECEAQVIDIFRQAAEQEKAWADYLFEGGSMIGLNADILKDYVEYITNVRARALGYEKLFDRGNTNPLPWMNAWLSTDNVQVAPQEVEVSSYLTGAVETKMDLDDLKGFSL
jgi:ribonucleoside-diphosphate reductase beta chain